MNTENNEILYSYKLPYALDIQLYKHNYYDNLIISYLKKYTRYDKLYSDSDGFIVTVDDFKEILEEKFTEELNSSRAFTENSPKNNITTVYFLDKIFTNFTNLEYVKVNISNERDFTRVMSVGKDKEVINFDYRIVTAVLDVPKYVQNDEELFSINELFKEIGLMPTEDTFGKRKTYITTTSQELLMMINNKQDKLMQDEDSFEQKYLGPIEFIYDIIDQKCESDNSKLIVITDYSD